jgi:glycosyltransferase involved in cell wall biosynthesis
LLARLRLELADRLRHHRYIRSWISKAAVLRARIQYNQNHLRATLDSIDRLCQAARLAPNPAAMANVEHEIARQVSRLPLDDISWPDALPSFRRDRLEKAVILKAPAGPSEPGVLFLSFEYQWARLLALPNLAQLCREYRLVLAPTWSPPHSLINCVFPTACPAPSLVSLISNQDDLATFPRLSSKNIMVPLLASNWVNPNFYEPVPFAEKDLDIFMLANFGTYKRQFALFQALAHLPRHLKVRLIGQRTDGRTVETLRSEARLYGVEDRFEVLENASDEVVAQSFARAKISLILSRQEGSCVAVVESMFANTPVGIYRDAIIGSRTFINPHTGRFLEHGPLAPQLADFLAAAQRFAPRQWALDNGVCCFASSVTLNQALQSMAQSAGEPWTVDIAPLYWRPDPILVNESDCLRLAPAALDFQARYGFALGRAQPTAPHGSATSPSPSET